MLETIATFTLGALVAAFAVCAVLLNESEHAARRRLRRERRGAPEPTPAEAGEAIDLSGEDTLSRDGRRLPVGDFLFGALYLRGDEPLALAELAASAGDAGLDIGQTIAWLDRAEESGLVERIQDAEAAQPAVRLTELGRDVARNNRRGTRRPVEARASQGREQGL